MAFDGTKPKRRVPQMGIVRHVANGNPERYANHGNFGYHNPPSGTSRNNLPVDVNGNSEQETDIFLQSVIRNNAQDEGVIQNQSLASNHAQFSVGASQLMYTLKNEMPSFKNADGFPLRRSQSFQRAMQSSKLPMWKNVYSTMMCYQAESIDTMTSSQNEIPLAASAMFSVNEDTEPVQRIRRRETIHGHTSVTIETVQQEEIFPWNENRKLSKPPSGALQDAPDRKDLVADQDNAMLKGITPDAHNSEEMKLKILPSSSPKEEQCDAQRVQLEESNKTVDTRAYCQDGPNCDETIPSEDGGDGGDDDDDDDDEPTHPLSWSSFTSQLQQDLDELKKHHNLLMSIASNSVELDDECSGDEAADGQQTVESDRECERTKSAIALSNSDGNNSEINENIEETQTPSCGLASSPNPMKDNTCHALDNTCHALDDTCSALKDVEVEPNVTSHDQSNLDGKPQAYKQMKHPKCAENISQQIPIENEYDSTIVHFDLIETVDEDEQKRQTCDSLSADCLQGEHGKQHSLANCEEAVFEKQNSEESASADMGEKLPSPSPELASSLLSVSGTGLALANQQNSRISPNDSVSRETGEIKVLSKIKQLECKPDRLHCAEDNELSVHIELKSLEEPVSIDLEDSSIMHGNRTSGQEKQSKALTLLTDDFGYVVEGPAVVTRSDTIAECRPALDFPSSVPSLADNDSGKTGTQDMNDLEGSHANNMTMEPASNGCISMDESTGALSLSQHPASPTGDLSSMECSPSVTALTQDKPGQCTVKETNVTPSFLNDIKTASSSSSSSDESVVAVDNSYKLPIVPESTTEEGSHYSFRRGLEQVYPIETLIANVGKDLSKSFGESNCSSPNQTLEERNFSLPGVNEVEFVNKNNGYRNPSVTEHRRQFFYELLSPQPFKVTGWSWAPAPKRQESGLLKEEQTAFEEQLDQKPLDQEVKETLYNSSIEDLNDNTAENNKVGTPLNDLAATNDFIETCGESCVKPDLQDPFEENSARSTGEVFQCIENQPSVLRSDLKETNTSVQLDFLDKQAVKKEFVHLESCECTSDSESKASQEAKGSVLVSIESSEVSIQPQVASSLCSYKYMDPAKEMQSNGRHHGTVDQCTLPCETDVLLDRLMDRSREASLGRSSPYLDYSAAPDAAEEKLCSVSDGNDSVLSMTLHHDPSLSKLNHRNVTNGPDLDAHEGMCASTISLGESDSGITMNFNSNNCCQGPGSMLKANIVDGFTSEKSIQERRDLEGGIYTLPSYETTSKGELNGLSSNERDSHSTGYMVQRTEDNINSMTSCSNEHGTTVRQSNDFFASNSFNGIADDLSSISSFSLHNTSAPCYQSPMVVVRGAEDGTDNFVDWNTSVNPVPYDVPRFFSSVSSLTATPNSKPFNDSASTSHPCSNAFVTETSKPAVFRKLSSFSQSSIRSTSSLQSSSSSMIMAHTGNSPIDKELDSNGKNEEAITVDIDRDSLSAVDGSPEKNDYNFEREVRIRKYRGRYESSPSHSSNSRHIEPPSSPSRRFNKSSSMSAVSAAASEYKAPRSILKRSITFDKDHAINRDEKASSPVKEKEEPAYATIGRKHFSLQQSANKWKSRSLSRLNGNLPALSLAQLQDIDIDSANKQAEDLPADAKPENTKSRRLFGGSKKKLRKQLTMPDIYSKEGFDMYERESLSSNKNNRDAPKRESLKKTRKFGSMTNLLSRLIAPLHKSTPQDPSSRLSPSSCSLSPSEVWKEYTKDESVDPESLYQEWCYVIRMARVVNSNLRSEDKVRTVVLQRGKKGFGFVLRGAKAAQLKKLKVDFVPTERMPALQYLDSVEDKSVADKAGLKSGDFLVEINGTDVVHASHETTVELIRRSSDVLALKFVRVDTFSGGVWTDHRHMDGTSTLPHNNRGGGLLRPHSHVANSASETEAIEALNSALACYESPGSSRASSANSTPIPGHKVASIRPRPASVFDNIAENHAGESESLDGSSNSSASHHGPKGKAKKFWQKSNGKGLGTKGMGARVMSQPDLVLRSEFENGVSNQKQTLSPPLPAKATASKEEAMVEDYYKQIADHNKIRPPIGQRQPAMSLDSQPRNEPSIYHTTFNNIPPSAAAKPRTSHYGSLSTASGQSVESSFRPGKEAVTTGSLTVGKKQYLSRTPLPNMAGANLIYHESPVNQSGNGIYERPISVMNSPQSPYQAPPLYSTSQSAVTAEALQGVQLRNKKPHAPAPPSMYATPPGQSPHRKVPPPPPVRASVSVDIRSDVPPPHPTNGTLFVDPTHLPAPPVYSPPILPSSTNQGPGGLPPPPLDMLPPPPQEILSPDSVFESSDSTDFPLPPPISSGLDIHQMTPPSPSQFADTVVKDNSADAVVRREQFRNHRADPPASGSSVGKVASMLNQIEAAGGSPAAGRSFARAPNSTVPVRPAAQSHSNSNQFQPALSLEEQLKQSVAKRRSAIDQQHPHVTSSAADVHSPPAASPKASTPTFTIPASKPTVTIPAPNKYKPPVASAKPSHSALKASVLEKWGKLPGPLSPKPGVVTAPGPLSPKPGVVTAPKVGTKPVPPPKSPDVKRLSNGLKFEAAPSNGNTVANEKTVTSPAKKNFLAMAEQTHQNWLANQKQKTMSVGSAAPAPPINPKPQIAVSQQKAQVPPKPSADKQKSQEQTTPERELNDSLSELQIAINKMAAPNKQQQGPLKIDTNKPSKPPPPVKGPKVAPSPKQGGVVPPPAQFDHDQTSNSASLSPTTSGYNSDSKFSDLGKEDPSNNNNNVEKKHVDAWTAEDVVEWLASIGLSEYRDNFLENSIEGETLLILTKSDLKDLGVEKIGHKIKLDKEIQKLVAAA